MNNPLVTPQGEKFGGHDPVAGDGLSAIPSGQGILRKG